MSLRRLLFGLWIGLLIFGLGAGSAAAAASHVSGSTSIEEVKVDPSFGSKIIFWARFQFAGTPTQVQVFLKSQNETASKYGLGVIQGDEVTYTYDLTAEPLPAFATVEYWFGVTYTDGSTFVSQKYSFNYEDNRFPWQVLHTPPLYVHWYEGDLAFGQSVMDIAQTGLEHANALLPLSANVDINIYVYASAVEMQSTVEMAGMNLIAGHASPELNTVVVSLPAGPDQLQETQRQVPHELMHILMYQSLGKSYDSLPTWLNEGLASNNELFANPDYVVILNDAEKNRTLIPMASLCHGFPTEASSFYQSYAEAQSFVRFLFQQYGKSGLQKLIKNYSDGLECDRGMEVAFNKNLTRMDLDWQKKELNQSVFGKIMQPLLPWLSLLLIVLVVPLILTVNNLLKEKFPKNKSSEPQKTGSAATKAGGSHGR